MLRRFSTFAIIAGLAAALVSCSGSPKSSSGSAVRATRAASLSSLPSDSKKVGIGSVQMAASIAKDGSAANPSTAFRASNVRTIIAVLALQNLPAGTRLSYIRYLDSKFVNSKTATLTKAAKYFYFQFNAEKGKQFAKGHYRLRLYVNGHVAVESAYDVF